MNGTPRGAGVWRAIAINGGSASLSHRTEMSVTIRINLDHLAGERAVRSGRPVYLWNQPPLDRLELRFGSENDKLITVPGQSIGKLETGGQVVSYSDAERQSWPHDCVCR